MALPTWAIVHCFMQKQTPIRELYFLVFSFKISFDTLLMLQVFWNMRNLFLEIYVCKLENGSQKHPKKILLFSPAHKYAHSFVPTSTSTHQTTKSLSKTLNYATYVCFFQSFLNTYHLSIKWVFFQILFYKLVFTFILILLADHFPRLFTFIHKLPSSYLKTLDSVFQKQFVF